MKEHTIEFQILQTRVYKVNFLQNIQQLKVLKVSSSIFNSTVELGNKELSGCPKIVP